MTRMQRRYELASSTNGAIQTVLYSVSDLNATVVIKADSALEISRTDAINVILDIENERHPFDPDDETIS